MDEAKVIDLIQKGVYKAFDRHLRFFGWVVLLLCAASWVYNKTDMGKDSTDSPDGRSNMVVRTDHLTGCEYLESSGGGLTPRLNAGGGHEGCR